MRIVEQDISLKDMTARVITFSKHPNEHVIHEQKSVRQILSIIAERAPNFTTTTVGMCIPMLMALATMDTEIAHRSKRTAAFILSQMALNPFIKDSLQEIVACLVALVLHSGNSTRLESAISTAFEFVDRRHGNRASDMFLRHIGELKFNGYLEAKAQHIQDTLSR